METDVKPARLLAGGSLSPSTDDSICKPRAKPCPSSRNAGCADSNEGRGQRPPGPLKTRSCPEIRSFTGRFPAAFFEHGKPRGTLRHLSLSPGKGWSESHHFQRAGGANRTRPPTGVIHIAPVAPLLDSPYLLGAMIPPQHSGVSIPPAIRRLAPARDFFVRWLTGCRAASHTCSPIGGLSSRKSLPDGVDGSESHRQTFRQVSLIGLLQ